MNRIKQAILELLDHLGPTGEESYEDWQDAVALDPTEPRTYEGD